MGPGEVNEMLVMREKQDLRPLRELGQSLERR
jgi:hypothetical protein